MADTEFDLYSARAVHRRRGHQRDAAGSLPGERAVFVVIAIRKLIRGTLLIAVALLLVGVWRHRESVAQLEALVASPRFADMPEVVMALTGAGLHLIRTFPLHLALFAAVMAALEYAQGVGLLLQRRWAHYLTAVITASLLPLEVANLAHGIQPLPVALLALNVAVVVFLVWTRRLWPLAAR